jgi:CRP-like cAMP-binding protein
MQLSKHIQKLTELDANAVAVICNQFTQIAARKKEILLEEGQRCSHYYYVEKGCLRLYFTDEKGIEQTIQFALESWWITDLNAFNKNSNSSYSIQALEISTLMGIENKTLHSLMEKHPELEKYFRKIYERAYSAALFRMKVLRLPKDISFNKFEKQYPEFVQRIPQKILASFLGFTPEYLSELRRKKVKHQ